ncbi:peptide-methionine (R)-S-oxide reductase MsrB [Sphingomonas suaedae]|uniref:peptide-methionine (R)-S-oxide reductase n=1 Tax=Sphingomonas suaedae TaxID=2599297 RepID=A0A518RHN9_9SPHN|nr:peptide-methionine (R)-S-oxide reductase MsrB [Sphingomonas suaedae]QDX26929.1 peptide-methionine (R)-S-oxide reductase MsrB [Sphingomonas suaedae]
MTQICDRRSFLTTSALTFAGGVAAAYPVPALAVRPQPLRLSDAEWRRRLSPPAYAVLRQRRTERPFSSPLDHEHRPGAFTYTGCSLPLFSSRAKFDSRTGWPSFWTQAPNATAEHRDATLGMIRTEVRCARCNGHLGHVFNDGPKPTGLRYCINGVALRFAPAQRTSS